MNTTYNFNASDDQAIVYVRPIKVDDLPRNLRDQAGGLETIYAVHNSEGEQLALVRDRAMAYSLARQNDMNPVAVH
ncbi:MAG: DUF1150 family protein [Pseudomonadota bacterium]